MGWIQLLILVLKYGPAIFSIVNEIIELIKHLRATGRTKEAAAAELELRAAVDDYRRTKNDRRRLKKLRNRLSTTCFGE